MFAVKARTEVVIRIFLIAVILFSALSPSTASATSSGDEQETNNSTNTHNDLASGLTLKGKLAIWLFQQYESLAKRYWGRHLWARGYCVSTVGLDEEKIRKYVQWQEKQEKQAEAVQGKLFD